MSSFGKIRDSAFKGWHTLAAGLLLAVGLGVVFINKHDNQPALALNTAPTNLELDSSALTFKAFQAAVEDRNDFPAYSPDGRYVVYPRYLVEDHAHLWARDLAYGYDFLITEEAGQYAYLAWSPDGSQMLFVDSSCFQATCQPEQCSSLKSATLSQSETNAPTVLKLVDCSQDWLVSPEWINKQSLVVLEINDASSVIARYDIREGIRNVLYSSNSMLPYDLSYSRQTGVLTIMTLNPAGQKELLFLNLNSGTLNRNDAVLNPPQDDWYPSSTPL